MATEKRSAKVAARGRTTKAPAVAPSKAKKPATAAPAARRTRDGTNGHGNGHGKAAAAATVATAAKAKAKGKGSAASRARADIVDADPTLFAPLTPGEIADALRTLTEDRRLAQMAKVGRYRVVATEPLVIKPPHWMAGHRLARVVIYDYAADRCADACVDLDAGVVAHINVTRAQPMLSREEEAVAISVAMLDDRIRDKLSLGDEPQVAAHYWGRTTADLAYSRRSAAVIFGQPGGHPSLVVVVDLIDNVVTSVVPAAEW